MSNNLSLPYSEKLRDPRWQKKRLEILDRDEWICRGCFRDDIELHVHHLIYKKNKEPWEYESGFLISLCKECHEDEVASKDILTCIAEINNVFLKKGMEPWLLHDLAEAISFMRPMNPPGFEELCQKIKELCEGF